MSEHDEGVVVKKIMHVMRRPPYGTIYTYEGLEMILVMAAFEQDISVAFIDDGVYSIVKGQETDGIGIKGFANTFRALDGYDVEKLYVDKESMEERGLSEEDFLVDVEILPSKKIGEMMLEQEVIIHH